MNASDFDWSHPDWSHLVAGWAAHQRADADAVRAVDAAVRAGAALELELEEVLAAHRLTRPSFLVLVALLRAPDRRLTQRQLRGAVARTSGNLSMRLGRLERTGLVEREAHATDRRGVNVTLTDRGAERVERALPDYVGAAERLARALGGDRAAVVDGLARWVDGLGADPGTAPRLGVAVAPPPVAARMRRAVGLPDLPGVLVLKARRESPAAQAGLDRGDLITGVAGEPVHTIGDLQRAVTRAGGTVALDVVRGVEGRRVEVALSAER